MKKVFTFSLSVSIFFLFFLVLQQISVSAQVLSSGEEIFIQGKCVRCHTIGKGRFVGPDLLGVGERYSRDDLIRWAKDPESLYSEKKKKPINEGYPPMPPMNLSESDAQRVADYLLEYTPPPGLSESGTIMGQVRNITTQKPQEGQDVVLISYMGDRKEERHFAKSDSLGRFSFPSLRWDRSYEIALFHQGVQYVSGKMVFLPGKDEITLDLPVYDTTSSDENISLLSLNVIIYPNDEGSKVNVTSLHAFENSGDTVFTGEQTDSDTTTLVFPIPENAVDVTFSDGVNPEAVVRKEEKLYSRLPFLPGMKRVALGYSLPLSQIGENFSIGFDYEVGDLAVFARKTELGIRLERPQAVAEEVMIHDEAFLKYVLSGVKPGGIVLVVSNTSFLMSNLSRYLPVALFFVFAAVGIMYFLYGKNRFSSMNSEK
ncbi:MAG: cytochrome c [Candidatus Dadabacteria bacterium]|nr:cytochrome c [Candidatus Dadabacteria bacterium]MDE0663926.1 cytochrome c [Candidatus Dadabacteria bacterium]